VLIPRTPGRGPDLRSPGWHPFGHRAAAQVKVLIPQIAERMYDVFRFCYQVAAEPPHQTLRHDRMGATCSASRRKATFPPPSVFAAAVAWRQLGVCSGAASGQAWLVLGMLVDKSLVVKEEHGEQEALTC
jgi:hypothetical protein